VHALEALWPRERIVHGVEVLVPQGHPEAVHLAISEWCGWYAPNHHLGVDSGLADGNYGVLIDLWLEGDYDRTEASPSLTAQAHAKDSPSLAPKRRSSLGDRIVVAGSTRFSVNLVAEVAIGPADSGEESHGRLTGTWHRKHARG
jgi:hypothetical protein